MATTIEIKTTEVADKGQVAIPVEFQKTMRLKKGDKIVLMLKDESLVLQKSEVVSKKLEKESAHIQTLSERSPKQIWDNDKDEIWNDYLK